MSGMKVLMVAHQRDAAESPASLIAEMNSVGLCANCDVSTVFMTIIIFIIIITTAIIITVCFHGFIRLVCVTHVIYDIITAIKRQRSLTYHCAAPVAIAKFPAVPEGSTSSSVRLQSQSRSFLLRVSRAFLRCLFARCPAPGRLSPAPGDSVTRRSATMSPRCE